MVSFCHVQKTTEKALRALLSKNRERERERESLSAYISFWGKEKKILVRCVSGEEWRPRDAGVTTMTAKHRHTFSSSSSKTLGGGGFSAAGAICAGGGDARSRKRRRRHRRRVQRQ